MPRRSTITWNTNVNAPCCPGEIQSADGRSLLIQTDTDYPSVAMAFGWSIRSAQRCPTCGHKAVEFPMSEGTICDACGKSYAICSHGGTDGTIDCAECGCTVAAFIGAAYDWLRDNDGATADDPGYFTAARS